MPTNDSDIVSKIMDYESGAMDLDEIVVFFQELYDSGILPELQGSYHRAFAHLLSNGLVRTNNDAS
jgi:hypothetical protein